MEDDAERIRGELEKARQNLQRTVTEVNRKVESIGTHLRPTRWVERNIGLSMWIGGILGFALGGADGTLGTLVLGGVLGAAINEARRDASRNSGIRSTKA
jgi:hypothetical protein